MAICKIFESDCKNRIGLNSKNRSKRGGGAMLTYISLDMIKASIMAVVILFLIAGAFKLRRRSILIAIGVIVATIFIGAFNSFTNAQENITHFQRGWQFICRSGNDNEYRVSKADGWEIDKDYFSKNTLLIRADRCEEQ